MHIRRNGRKTAQRSGFSAKKLRWWQGRFARTRAAEGTSPAFVAVELTDPASASPLRTTPALELTTPSGHRISVPTDFDAGHLRRLLAALEPSC